MLAPSNRSKTLAEVKALDAGYKFSTDHGATFPHRGKGLTIPTLKEVLDALPASNVSRTFGWNSPNVASTIFGPSLITPERPG